MRTNRTIWNLTLFYVLAILGVLGQAQEIEKQVWEKIKTQAENGDAEAQYKVGLAYANGTGVKKDMAEALAWLHKSADQGYTAAEERLGYYFQKDWGVLLGLDPEGTRIEAVKWFRKAAEQGNADAQQELGSCYQTGSGVSVDPKEAVVWFRKAAAQGNARAEFELGDCFSGGLGVTKDLVEAFKWFLKAAKHGDPNGQNRVGTMYLSGEGVAKDPAAAVNWFRSAAEQGDLAAQYRVGCCYQNGEGVPKDSVEAVKWLRKAADQGDADAATALGSCYLTGAGVTKDPLEALKWYHTVTDRENTVAPYQLARAQAMVGWCLAHGEGVNKDMNQAATWYRRAAERGEAQAQNSLGVCYQLGDGVPKDYVEAYRWYDVASAQGNGFAKTNLVVLERLMTRDQIAEAQRLAAGGTLEKPQQHSQHLPERELPSTQPSGSGTGFFITEDGFLVTNEHVIEGASQIRILTGAGILPATVVSVDKANDIALLKTSGRFSALPISASRAVRLGNTVATVGFPNVGLQGFAPKLAKGEIASLSGAQDDPRYFQISVAVQPGNSGGALVDERGNVVGIVAAKLSAKAALVTSGSLPENVNYAVKSSFLLGFLESVPQISTRLKSPNSSDRKFEDVVKQAQEATGLVLVY